MIAVDTNVLARIAAADEPKQLAAALALFAEHPVFIPKTVLLEAEWVLRAIYLKSTRDIARYFAGLLEAENVSIEDEAGVASAVEWLAAGMDFADAVHLASSARATAFYTFDDKLRRRARRAKGAPKVAVP